MNIDDPFKYALFCSVVSVCYFCVAGLLLPRRAWHDYYSAVLSACAVAIPLLTILMCKVMK